MKHQLRRLDYDDLLVLREIVATKKVTAVANILCVTQPAVTQRMRKIEAILGFKLVTYHHRSVVPTGLCILAAKMAENALEQINYMSTLLRVQDQDG